VRKIYLSLTGGLGNQLFQVAAAVSIADGDAVEIEWINSRPRLNHFQEPEVSDFILPKNVTFQKRHKFQVLNSKSIGYLLRSGIEPKRIEKFKLYGKVTALLTSIINITTFKRFIKIYVNQGVGYTQGKQLKNRSSLHLVGYFQTYKWSEGTESINYLKNFTVKEKSPQLLELIKLAAKEDPLIVHMRFGDYRMENTFGLLTSKYYRESIRDLWNSGRFKSIWVFSDEIAQAQKYLDNMEIADFRFISDVANSSSQTLEAMRLGKGFVIGNSSFSWWAARTAYSDQVPVIAPSPWFIGQSEPIDLIPQNWMRRMGHE